MPTITESQLRFIIRQELINTLYENDLIEEGFLSDTLSKYSKYGARAALGAGLAIGGLEVAKPFDMEKTEIAYTASHNIPKMQDMGFELAQEGDMTTVSKNGKSVVVNKKTIEEELKQYKLDKTMRVGTGGGKGSFVDDIELYLIDKNMPESKKLVKFLESDSDFRAEYRKSYLYNFGQIGLVFFAVIALYSDTIGKYLSSIENQPRPQVKIPKINQIGSKIRNKPKSP